MGAGRGCFGRALDDEGRRSNWGNVTAGEGVAHEVLLESELEGWYTDEALWPKNRTLELFNKWVHVEYHTVVIDVVDAPLLDDEAP